MNSLVTIIIPIKNEINYIEGLLESIENQDYPQEKLEIILVDGNSNDGSFELLKTLQKSKKIKVLKNPLEIIPISMNLGIKEAKGKYIVRLDAHAKYNKEYVSTAIKILEEKNNVVSVGGYAYFHPANNTIRAIITAKVFSSYFATGNKLRVNSKTNLIDRYYDTAVYGVFRKNELLLVGGYNERLVVAQDIELYDRLKKINNGKIYLSSNMKIDYYFKSKTALDLFKRQYRISTWTLKRKQGLRARHLLPLITGIIGIVILGINYKLMLVGALVYISLCLYFYLIEIKTFKEKIWSFYAIYSFFMNHLGYFCGTIKSFIEYVKEGDKNENISNSSTSR